MSLAAVETPQHHFPSSRKSKSKANTKAKKPSSRDQQLYNIFSDIQTLYTSSKLSQTVTKHITSTFTKSTTTPIKTLLSLGLGSPTTPSKNQSRILKQLAIFLAISTSLEAAGHSVQLYAQDPIFTRADESFLSSLGISISRTTRGSELGEAVSLIDSSTVVYSPFLTLEAYEALLLHGAAGEKVRYLIGDDFEKLMAKWPKFSEERKQVTRLVKGAVGAYRRRALGGDGFWEEGDVAFPMALYERGDAGMVKAKM